jgi:hypothetical protein
MNDERFQQRSANLKDGKEEGLIQCWWEDGKLAQEGVKQKGVCVGIWKHCINAAASIIRDRALGGTSGFWKLRGEGG